MNEEKQTPKERYDAQKENKEKSKKNREMTRKSKRCITPTILAIVAVLIVAGFVWLIASGKSIPKNQIVARNGLHYHTQLSIVINGKAQNIPAGIGLGATEQPIHTHTPDGIIHMEFSGLVTKPELQLGNFFRTWGKQFSDQCILGHCVDSTHTLTMAVNGKPNMQYQNYVMHDHDKIDIVYGKKQATSTKTSATSSSTSTQTGK
jgi:hypothetical protein